MQMKEATGQEEKELFQRLGKKELRMRNKPQFGYLWFLQCPHHQYNVKRFFWKSVHLSLSATKKKKKIKSSVTYLQPRDKIAMTSFDAGNTSETA